MINYDLWTELQDLTPADMKRKMVEIGQALLDQGNQRGFTELSTFAMEKHRTVLCLKESDGQGPQGLVDMVEGNMTEYAKMRPKKDIYPTKEEMTDLCLNASGKVAHDRIFVAGADEIKTMVLAAMEDRNSRADALDVLAQFQKRGNVETMDGIVDVLDARDLGDCYELLNYYESVCAKHPDLTGEKSPHAFFKYQKEVVLRAITNVFTDVEDYLGVDRGEVADLVEVYDRPLAAPTNRFVTGADQTKYYEALSGFITRATNTTLVEAEIPTTKTHLEKASDLHR